jgi:hypothetical protein
MAAAFLKMGAFFIPIQPLSSQELRRVVRPSIAYIESETITKGMNL